MNIQLVVKYNGEAYPIINPVNINVDLENNSIDFQWGKRDINCHISGKLFKDNVKEIGVLKILSDVLNRITNKESQVPLTWYIDIYSDEYDKEISIRFEYELEPYLFIFDLESLIVTGLAESFIDSRFGVTFIVDELISKTDYPLVFDARDICLVSKDKVVITSGDNFPNEKITLDFKYPVLTQNTYSNLIKFVEDVRKMIQIGNKGGKFIVNLLQEKSNFDLYSQPNAELVISYNFKRLEEFSLSYPKVKVESKKWRSYVMKQAIDSYNRIMPKNDANPKYPLSNYLNKVKTYSVNLNSPLNLDSTFTGSIITHTVDIQSICYFDKTNHIMFYPVDTKYFSTLTLKINNDPSYSPEIITNKETMKILFDSIEKGYKDHLDFRIKIESRLGESGKPITVITPLFGRNVNYGEFCFNCTSVYEDETPEWLEFRLGYKE